MYLCWDTNRPGPLRRRPAGRGGAELRQAASGERHSLLLLSNGEVHSYGDNSHGQLGQRAVQRQEQPSECGTKVRGGGPGSGVLGAPCLWAPRDDQTMLYAACAQLR